VYISNLIIIGGVLLFGITIHSLHLDQVFELYGAKVEWDQETRSVLATKDDTEIKIVTSSRTAYVNGELINLAQGPINAKGTVLVGLRFVSEALGVKVQFDKKNLIVDIISE